MKLKYSVGDEVRVLSYDEICDKHPELINGAYTGKIYGISHAALDGIFLKNNYTISYVYDCGAYNLFDCKFSFKEEMLSLVNPCKVDLL